MKYVVMQYRDIVGLAVGTAFVLLVPLSAMLVTDQVAWELTDFVVAGALLFGAGVIYKLATGKKGDVTYRAAFCVGIGAALLLVWMNLAVGLIGREGNPANLMYLGVLVVGLVGAVLARFKPRGTAYALFATALAQVLVAVFALVVGMHSGNSVSKIVGLNGFFVVLFVASGLLFHRAARNERSERESQ
ncbi:MAG: hypothetical protein QNK37_07505 [Acidobacteriota bacterium]|nr:hypothetical protein [Acidobacteriota bacterium]